MRALLWSLKILLVLTALVVAVQVGRHLVPVQPEVRGVAPDASLGGSVDLDSVRAARAGVLRHIAGADSYLPAMLAEGDSVLKRWPERMTVPLTVYLPAGAVTGASGDKREAARRAFVRWERVGAIPVRFQFVTDSAQAEVVVRWIERFPIRRAGQADIHWNRNGWILRASLTLATHTTDGFPLGVEAVHTVALHEIGHLLGLGHSDDARDVMYPSTEVQDITARDRHTARLLYSVPPGSLRLGVSGDRSR
ncbi:MAG: M10 family metallopeptidase domain-containing protein [Gemmatimonadota bacterium]|nr:M10 family metallopeptidase domain-containing protein [Gemmatimonadota bacterium]